MKKIEIFFLLLNICINIVKSSDVIVLTTNDFDQQISENPLILVEFYAPWCGHCKKLEPEYEKAATQLKDLGLKLAKVDADAAENEPLKQRFQIRGFPTLKFFRNGLVSDYTGPRTAEGIVSWMKKQTLPEVSSLNTVEEVKDFSKSDNVIIVGFFDNKDSKEYTTFHEVAKQFRDSFTFGEVIENKEIFEQFEIESLPTVILFKSFDEGKNILSKDQFNELALFIKQNSVPLIDEVGPNNFNKYAETHLPLAFLFINPNIEGQKEEYVNKLKSIAKKTQGRLNWVYVDWIKYPKQAESLGLSGNKIPSIAIADMKDGYHYAFDENTEITTEKVEKWVDQFLLGELPPTIKSEEIPETQEGPVTVVVAKTFDKIVNDPTKDVFIEFYAPWCGHCKKLAPTYEELAQKLKHIDSLVIAKINGAANDFDPKLNIRGYPTLKLFRADKKDKPIDYNGDRTLEDLLEFIQEHVSIKFDLSESKEETKEKIKDEL